MGVLRVLSPSSDSDLAHFKSLKKFDGRVYIWYGSPLPEFETDEAHDYFVTRIFIHENFYENGGSDGGENGGSTTSKIPITEVQGQIVKMMLSNPHITKKEIAENLKMSVDGIRYHIKKMTESETIRYIGTSRNGHWEVLR